MSFSPRLDILQAPQRLLWEEFAEVPPEFTLYGDTAVALHLGHRHSVDFDFFGSKAINPGELYAEIPFLRGTKIIQQEKNTLTCLVDRNEPKAAVVQLRAEAKDYIDLDAIISAGIGLPQGLSAAEFIYGPSFNPQITLKALSFFGDGDLPSLPDEMKSRLVKAVAATDLSHLPAIDAKNGTGP